MNATRARALLVAGALAGSLVPPVLAAQRVEANLRLPSGWDDAYFDRLERGETPKTIVAVLEFSGGDLLQSHLRFSMSDMLITALVKAGRFTVVERERVADLRREQEFQQGGMVDPATAVQVGKLLGAELVVHGLVTKATEQRLDKFSYDVVRIEVAVDVRAVHTGSGQIVISRTAEAADEAKIITTADGRLVSGPTNYDPLYANAAMAALDSVAALVATATPLVGVVVAADGGEITTDLGERHGVKAGDAFVVFRRGDPITHPTTGARIGWRKTVLGRLEVAATEEAMATGRLVAVTDRAVRVAPGDYIMYEAPRTSR
ncbi:MAG TPA: CsgG/HfaB family protein [Gemmatimonadales bacterium]|nr:CsgG/HfaB family protein [Gemmatimonadales bacterium]